MKSLFILCVALFSALVQSNQEFVPYIVNGVRAPVAPYFAYIQFFQGQNNAWGGGKTFNSCIRNKFQNFKCILGALVSNQHIVTSASIVQP